jgi:hypothetical protein
MHRIALPAIAVLLGVTATAHAQTPNRSLMFPGSICQPVLGSRTSIHYTSLGAENVSTSTAKVSCPLPTNHFDENGLAVQLVIVWRTVASSISGTCTATGADGNGNALWQEEKTVFFGPAGVSSTTFNPNWIGLHATYWEVTCTIPPNGAALGSLFLGSVEPPPE